MKNLLSLALFAIAFAQDDMDMDMDMDMDGDKMMKGMCYGLNEYIWPMCGFFPWRVIGDWYVIWRADMGHEYESSCEQYRFDQTGDLFRHLVYYQGTWTWEEDGVMMSESHVELPSRDTSYNKYD